jgi:hypothetical protein
LPVSISGAFLINYLSSLLSVSLILFLPPMLALGLALVWAKGPAMLVVLPLLASFLFALTALTYQFQGWLASLMVNKRRRRTVIVVVTFLFILMCQLPNLINFLRPWDDQTADEVSTRYQEQGAELLRALSAQEITKEQYDQRLNAIHAAQANERAEANQRVLTQWDQTITLVNLILPPGWLPYGAKAAADGSVWPGMLALMAFTLLGSLSLWRAYRTTLRLYTGTFTSGARRPVVPKIAKPTRPWPNRLERRIPGISEPATAVALNTFQSLLRAPEAKMLALGPIVLAVLFGVLLYLNRDEVPVLLRPYLAYGALLLVLTCMIQILANQFGFDRNGFRTFVMAPSPRVDILLGKNLAMAPFALVLGLVFLLLLQILAPMRLDYLLTVLPGMATMYLAFCFFANLLTIYTPMHVTPGTLKPSNPRLIPILLQLVFFMLFPVVLAPLLLPIGLQMLSEHWAGIGWWPIALVLSVLELALVVFLYRLLLPWQGRLLHEREQEILAQVTSKD